MPYAGGLAHAMLLLFLDGQVLVTSGAVASSLGHFVLLLYGQGLLVHFCEDGSSFECMFFSFCLISIVIKFSWSGFRYSFVYGSLCVGFGCISWGIL